MPSAPPSSRARSLVAEPTPCFAAGSASVIAAVAGVMASPMPAPSGSRPASSSQYERVGVEPGQDEQSGGDQQQAEQAGPQSRRPGRPAGEPRPARPASSPAPSGPGSAPSTSGLSPRTSCRYCMTRKTKPKNAKNCRVIETRAGGERAVPEQPGVEQRRRVAQLPGDERAQQGQPGGDPQQGAGAGPARGRAPR